MTAQDEFIKIVPYKNPLTPDVMSIGREGKYLVELSRGTDMDGHYQYGVTVVDAIEKEQVHELSRLFGKYTTAVNYIKKLSKL